MTDFTQLQPKQAYLFRKTKLVYKHPDKSTKEYPIFVFENQVGVRIELSEYQITQHLKEISH